jgi:hypothetical protein
LCQVLKIVFWGKSYLFLSTAFYEFFRYEAWIARNSSVKRIKCEPVEGIISHSAAFSHQEPPIYSHYDTYGSLAIIFIRRRRGKKLVVPIDAHVISMLLCRVLFCSRRFPCARIPGAFFAHSTGFGWIFHIVDRRGEWVRVIASWPWCLCVW